MSQVLEPTLQTPWKLAVLGIGIIVFLLGYVAIGVAFLNRDYAPLKAKQLPVLFIALLSATCWWSGSLQALGVIQQTGIFQYCLLWSVWFQTILGVQLHLTIYSFRILRLYYILVLVMVPGGYMFWALVASVIFPAVIMGIIPMFTPGRYFSTLPVPIKGFESGDPACDFYDPIYANLMLFWALYALLLLLFLNFKVSRVRKAFNEYSENKYALLLLCFILVLNFVLGLGSQNFTWGKIVIVLSQLAASNALFWFTLYKPLIGLIFKKDAYLAQWKRGLRDENLPDALLYGVKKDSTTYSQNVFADKSQTKSFA